MTYIEYCKIVSKLENVIIKSKDENCLYNKSNLKMNLADELGNFFRKEKMGLKKEMLHRVAKMAIMVIIAGGKFDENRYIQLLQESHYLDDSYLLENLVVNEYHYSVDKLCYYINKFIKDFLEIDDLTLYDVLNECATQFIDDSYIPSYKK